MGTHRPVKSRFERSDVCAVPAAGVVLEAVVALALADAALERFGGATVGDLTLLSTPSAADPGALRRRWRVTPQQPPAVALVGFMGAGKSAVGRGSRRALGLPFVDTDALIVAAAGPIAEIFATSGEPASARSSATWSCGSSRHCARAPKVLALGGGAVLSDDVRRALRAPAARRLADRAARGVVGAAGRRRARGRWRRTKRASPRS